MLVGTTRSSRASRLGRDRGLGTEVAAVVRRDKARDHRRKLDSMAGIPPGWMTTRLTGRGGQDGDVRTGPALIYRSMDNSVWWREVNSNKKMQRFSRPAARAETAPGAGAADGGGQCGGRCGRPAGG